MSPKAKRIAAIARRYPAWSLTDGKPSAWLHIGAAFRHLDAIAVVRKRWPFLSALDREFLLSRVVPSEVRAAAFNLSLYANRLP